VTYHGTDLIGPSSKAHAWLVISYHHYLSKTASQTATVPLLQAAKMSEAEFCLHGRVNSSSFNQSEPTCFIKKLTCHVALAVLANVQQFAITKGI